MCHLAYKSYKYAHEQLSHSLVGVQLRRTDKAVSEAGKAKKAVEDADAAAAAAAAEAAKAEEEAKAAAAAQQAEEAAAAAAAATEESAAADAVDEPAADA